MWSVVLLNMICNFPVLRYGRWGVKWHAINHSYSILLLATRNGVFMLSPEKEIAKQQKLVNFWCGKEGDEFIELLLRMVPMSTTDSLRPHLKQSDLLYCIKCSFNTIMHSPALLTRWKQQSWLGSYSAPSIFSLSGALRYPPIPFSYHHYSLAKMNSAWWHTTANQQIFADVELSNYFVRVLKKVDNLSVFF